MNEMPVHLHPPSIAPCDPADARVSRKSVTLLVLLSAVYGIQYLNQILLGLLVQSIKHELLLSDTQIGLLTGVAFSLFYVALGFPLARWADKHNRKMIIVVSVVLFSAATIACGLVTGFITLFVARICVAVGEAGTMPSAVSMLADEFKPSVRRWVMSIHSSGAFLGTAVGIYILYAFAAAVGWRAIFWAVGISGLALAALVGALGHEPKRQSALAASRSFLPDIETLARNTPYVFIALGLAVASIPSSAAINWTPAFLARSYGLTEQNIFLFLAAVWGVGATSGSVAAGYATNWLHRIGGHWPLLALSLLSLLFPLIFVLAFSTGALWVSFAAIFVAFFVMGGVRGPAFATVQDIVPGNLQATASAVLMFSMYAIGVTLGPLLTGVISDALKAWAGPESLGYALSITMVVGGTGAAGLFALGAISLKPSL